MDSLAPARSALTGFWLRQSPFAVFPNGSSQIHQPKVGGPSRAGEERLPWETVLTNSSTLKELHQIRRRPDPTPSELFSFCPFTQRSRYAPTLG